MKIIFLDRDGVINKYPGFGNYVTKWSEFEFLAGAKEAIKKLTLANFKIFVVSNQAGLGKGIFSQEDLEGVTKSMLQEIKEEGGKIEGVFYCVHKEEDGCLCRKPKTGLIDNALKNYDLTKLEHRPFFIGDSLRDINTAKKAGLMSILVLSGEEKIENKPKWSVQPDLIVSNLLEIAHLLTHT